MFTKVWDFTKYVALPAEFTFTRPDAAKHYNSAGLLVTAAIDAPRFDFNPATLAALGLLLEGPSENVCLQSEDITTAPWQNTWTGGTTITANDAIAPDGNLTADLSEQIDSAGDAFYTTFTLTAATICTASTFIQNQDATRSKIIIYDNNAGALHASIEVLWTAGVPSVFASTAALNISFEQIGGAGGWYRAQFQFTTAAVVGTHLLIITPESGGTSTTGIWVWGSQVEELQFATSYITTLAAAVTRNDDLLVTIPAGGLPFVGYNTAEGAFTVEYDLIGLSPGTNQFLFHVDSGSSADRISMYHPNFNHAHVWCVVSDATVAQTNMALGSPSTTLEPNEKSIAAFSYKLNNFIGVTDASPAAYDLLGTTPAAVNIMRVGDRGAGFDPLHGHISKLSYFDEHLPAQSLAALTLASQNYHRSSQAVMQVASDADGITASAQAVMQAATDADGKPASSQAAILVAHYPDATEAVRDAQLLMQAATKDLTGKPASTQQAMLVAYRTGTVENLLSRAWTFTLDGHTFYVITLGEQGTFVFDRTTEQWAQWRTYGMPVWNMEIGTTWKGNIIAADQSNPVIWELEPRSFLDDDFKPMQRVVTGGLPVRGRDYVENYAFRITASLGKFDLPTTVPATVATVRLRFSDDQGKTFTDAGILTMEAGNWVQELAWTSLGSMHAPGRLFEVSDEGAVTRIDDADAENGDNG